MKTNYFKISFIILTTLLGLMACKKKDYPPQEGALSAKFVTTLAPQKVTTTSADLRGIHENTLSSNIIERGIYISESENPLMADVSKPSGYKGEKFQGVSTGGNAFVVSLSDLKDNTKYTYVAFTTTLSGTSYGGQKILATSFGIVNDIDGNQYQTVKIGKQVWMRENLKSKNYSDQTSVNGYYDLETDHIYGKHYNWNSANRVTSGAKSGSSEGVCPTGWHIPSDGEWQQLLNYVGVSSDELNSLDLIGYNHAEQLKDADTDNWDNEMVNNRTGFSVLPAGICSYCDQEICCQAAFWTSTPNMFYGFQTASEKIMRGNHPDCNCGLSVRCVKN